MANSVVPKQTAPLDLHCLHMSFCQKSWKHMGLAKAGLNSGGLNFTVVKCSNIRTSRYIVKVSKYLQVKYGTPIMGMKFNPNWCHTCTC